LFNETQVTYELILMVGGGEFTERFSQSFDSKIYNDDIEGTDWMVVGFKMQELKEKYGDDLMLLEMIVERGVVH